MDSLLPLLLAIVPGLTGLFGAVLTLLRSRRYRNRAYLESISTGFDSALGGELRSAIEALPDDARSQVIDPLARTEHAERVSREELEVEIERRVEVIKDRIENIETRFPDVATLDKVASINDAILATKIDALSADVRRLQDNLLSKWDVATVVFAILGALGVIVGAVVGIVNLAT